MNFIVKVSAPPKRFPTMARSDGKNFWTKKQEMKNSPINSMATRRRVQKADEDLKF